MTLSRDELRTLIREVMEEQQSERMAHSARREKVTRYTDPEGKTWMSATLERGEVVRKVLAVVVVVIASTAGLVAFTNQWFLLPTIDSRADIKIEAHEQRIREEMDAKTPAFVTRAEFDRRVAASDARWEAQDARYVALTEWLTRVEGKLDRAIERGR